MITRDNFKQALLSLGYEEEKSGVLTKQFGNLIGSRMTADFNSGQLDYFRV